MAKRAKARKNPHGKRKMLRSPCGFCILTVFQHVFHSAQNSRSRPQRSAEELVFGSVTTGAVNDIEQATKLARSMITRYGMSEDFDMVAMETVTNQYLGGDSSLACSAETQSRIDEQVVALVRRQHEKALGILTDNRAKLDELADYLYEHETITGEEFMQILNAA